MRTPIVLALLFTSAATAQSVGKFTPTGNLTRQRLFHTATLLTNGRVLIAGGFAILAGWPAWASAELYDPSTGTFTATGDMTAARYFHTATVLPDGKVLIAGGNNSIAGGSFLIPLVSAELYDPATGAFTPTGEMTTARSGHTATLLNNGKVLITGGAPNKPSATAELYDPAAGTFTATGRMAAARWGLKATLLASGKVLIDGGRSEDDFDDRPNAEVYDPDTGAFTVSGKSAYAGTFPAASTLLTNGKVLDVLTYSCDPSDLAEVYEPSAGTFTATAKMNKARGYSTGLLLPDGKVWVAGRDGSSWPNGSAEIYDPVTGRFIRTDDLVMNREEGHTATLLPDGTVLLGGGWICCGYSVDTAEIYRPAVLAPAPALFSVSGDGRGQGAILHANTDRLASSGSPAAVGEALEIYLSGLTNGSVIPPQVIVGGRMAEVLWFGSAPGYPGLNQVNIRVPKGVVAGLAVPVRLLYLSRPSNEVTIAVR
jgi:hypothetical protein